MSHERLCVHPKRDSLNIKDVDQNREALQGEYKSSLFFFDTDFIGRKRYCGVEIDDAFDILMKILRNSMAIKKWRNEWFNLLEGV